MSTLQKIKLCLECGDKFSRKNARDYCDTCSPIVKKRKTRLTKKKYDAEKGTALKKETYNRIKSTGKEINLKWGGSYIFDNPAHGIKIVIPFTRDFSKNKVHVVQGRIMRWQKTNEAKEALTAEIVAMGHVFFQAKIWLKILVFQPDHQGDALNYVDTIADAIEDAIGVNDRWYSLQEVDWTIDKNCPRIEVWIKQNAQEDHAICKACGREVPFSKFPEGTQKRLIAQRTVGGTAGSRVCVECITTEREERKNKKGGSVESPIKATELISSNDP